MKKVSFLYNYIKRECAVLKHTTSKEVRAVMLHGIYKAAYEYVKNGGKRDIDTIIKNAERG